MNKKYQFIYGNHVYIILTFILIILTIYTFNYNAVAEEEIMDLIVDIGPHVSLEIPDDISFTVDKPWQGGLKEVKASLYIETNAEVELSWESTALINKENGRSLPLGIPEEIIKKLSEKEKLKAEEQPFGLNALLIDRRVNFENNLSDYNILTGENKGVYNSKSSKNKDKLFNKDRYVLSPGNYDFEVLIHYYWSEDANWSEITAGVYQGKIIYTVSALD